MSHRPWSSVLPQAAGGVVAGAVLAVMWRFSVPRRYTDAANPTSPGDGKPAYFVVYDYVRYVGGPNWWPVTGEFCVMGLLVGCLVGLGALRIWRKPRPYRPLTSSFVLAAGAGSVTGLLAALVTTTQRPTVVSEGFRNYTGPLTIEQAGSTPDYPGFLDLHISYFASFILVGAMTAGLVGGIAAWVAKRRSQHIPSETHLT